MITETMMLDQPDIPEEEKINQQTLEDMKEEMELLGNFILQPVLLLQINSQRKDSGWYQYQCLLRVL